MPASPLRPRLARACGRDGGPQRLRAGAIALVLSLLAVAASARPFAEMVGLQVKFAQGQPLQTLDLLPDLGVRWVRDHVAWSRIEPEAGRYVDFPEDFVQRLEFYRRHDIGVVFVLGLSNRTAYPPTPEAPLRHVDPTAFARHAVAVATRLRAAGVRFVLEVWNEPHGQASELYGLLGGHWNGAPPSPWLDHYVALVQATVERVKAYDASVPVISNDDMWVLHYRFLERGLPRALDGFGVHPYTIGPPELIATAHDVDWARPYVVADASRSFGSAVRRLVETGRQRLGHTPQLWITEWGWRIGERDALHRVVDEDQVAAYLPRAFVTAAAAQVRVLCWFSMQDTSDGAMGLLDNEGRKHPAYMALRTMTRQLGEAEYAGQLSGQGSPANGLQIHAFRRGRLHVLVAWSPDDKVRRVAVPDELALEEAHDARGRRVPMRFPSGRPVELEIGGLPVYLSVRGPLHQGRLAVLSTEESRP